MGNAWRIYSDRLVLMGKIWSRSSKTHRYVIEARLEYFTTMHLQRETLMSQYGGCIEGPWDEIAIRYVMVTSHVARKRPGEAFNEQSQLISCVNPGFWIQHLTNMCCADSSSGFSLKTPGGPCLHCSPCYVISGILLST